MVFFIFIYTILNAIVSSAGFQNKYRISFGGGVEVGIMEALLLMGLIVGTFWGGSGNRADRDPVDRTHPALVLCLVFLGFGFLCGVFGMFMHDASLRFKLVFTREFFGMPAAVYTGYRLVPSLRAGAKIPYAFVIGGIGTSIFLLAAFVSGSERYALRGDTNALRTVQFITNYAGVGTALLLYSVLSGYRLFPTVVTLALAGFCFVGQLAPLHRSDWVAQMAAISAIPLGLRPGERFKQAIRLVLAAIALTISLWIGLHLASALTGRNFHRTFEQRVLSMLPGERLRASDQKAWDTRLPAMQYELQMWLTSPVIGHGFAAQEAIAGSSEAGGDVTWGFHHNAYTSTLAQVGIIGFAGVVMAVWSPIFIGIKLVRNATDRGSVLMGGLGIVCGCQQAVLGMATASFNGYRMAMMIGLISGMCFKMRDMQLTAQRLHAEYGYSEYNQDQVINDMLPIPNFDDHGRPVGYPSYN